MNVRLPAAAALIALGLTACSGPAAPAPVGDALSGTIVVYAAASLTATFTTLAADFEADHPGTTVTLNFAGSSDLATQITEGAPADVFATADKKNMAKVTGAGLAAGTPMDFATNTLEIAVPPDNPAGVTSLADLASAGVTTVVCAPQVPCGAATAAVMATAGLSLTPASEESSVTDVLGKITSGEADAGLVYVTDVRTAGDAVLGIEFPESSSAVNTYPIVAVTDGALAAAFVEYATGSAARDVLAAAGFGAP
ncbi:MAG: molybdate ABC transporter substrate-binding protein [Burkholderiaceae bacterium]|nr:molybdate ABC transporter substrate-binding protein [Microbacteriaceae bacterium]